MFSIESRCCSAEFKLHVRQGFVSDNDCGHAEKGETFLRDLSSRRLSETLARRLNETSLMFEGRSGPHSLLEQINEPFVPIVVVVNVNQNATMGYNENVAFAARHTFAHAESGFRRWHSIHVQVVAQFPKGTCAL